MIPLRPASPERCRRLPSIINCLQGRRACRRPVKCTGEATVPRRHFACAPPVPPRRCRGWPADKARPASGPQRSRGSTFDLLGETHSLRVGQRLRLLVDVPDVQHLAHELDYGLGFVEGGGRHCGTDSTMRLRSLPADGPGPSAGWTRPPQTRPAPLLQIPSVKNTSPSMLSIIFHMAGLTDWWKPNQTSLPPPRGW